MNAADVGALLAAVWMVVRLESLRSENTAAHDAITKKLDGLKQDSLQGAACETPGAGGLAQSSILLVNTHSPWIADWMPAPEDRRHAERWK